MKRTILFLALTLAVAGSALAQTAPDTATTAAAQGTYPAGTMYNGVPLSGIDVTAGALIPGDGTTPDGRLTLRLLGPALAVGGQQVITVTASITGGSRPAANVATITGTATVDMGDGTPPVAGVPVTATISTDANNQGTVALVLGTTTLPTAPIGDGTMTVEDLGQ